MLIENDKVKELVYSDNTVIFLLPTRENIRETVLSGYLHN